jgi:hypothetical protein
MKKVILNVLKFVAGSAKAYADKAPVLGVIGQANAREYFVINQNPIR